MPFSFTQTKSQYDPHHALELGKASDWAYLDEAAIKVKVTTEWGISANAVTFWSVSDTQCFAVGTRQEIIIAFRGTEPDNLGDWLTDADVDLKNTSLPGFVHDGFWKALEGVWSPVLAKVNTLRDNNQPIYLTGHSLGGALAVLAAMRFVVQNDIADAIGGIYTYGQPRAGNAEFAGSVNKTFSDCYFQFANNLDIVPHVPPATLTDYRHAGTLMYFDENGKLQCNPSPLSRLLDDVAGEAKALEAMNLFAPITDHSMDKDYLPLLESNLGVNPFA